ncbi:hypothetical protein ACM66B_006925 [Microbotryomycetes sp. NB124-2]
MSALRNPYSGEQQVDFDVLALQDDSFAAFVKRTAKGRPTIDWTDQHAIKALSTALLRRDFGLDVELPDDRLCPMVPGRMEYVLWIMQLALDVSSQNEEGHQLTGIDIGTGASAIYALLACKTLGACRMVGTEVDERSFKVATANVARNGIQDRIKLVLTKRDEPLLPFGILSGVERLDYTMCNPPFYSSAQEIQDSASGKQLDAFAACTGAENEMITPGGEVAFVLKLVEESLVVGTKVNWYSTLVGKHSSLDPIVTRLRQARISNYTVAELGHAQTKRWVIAWSFQDGRLPSDRYHNSSNAATAKFLAPSNTHTYHCPPPASVHRGTFQEHWEMLDRAQHVVSVILRGLDGVRINWTKLDVERRVGLLETEWNSWSRKARRAAGNQEQPMDAVGGGERGMQVDVPTERAQEIVKFEAKLTLTVEVGTRDDAHVMVVADWTRGYDRNVKDWTTLWSFLIRKMAEAAKAAA